MKTINVSPVDVPYRLVNFGIDTLVLNVRYPNPEQLPREVLLPEPLITCLDAWQAAAKEQEAPVATSCRFQNAPLMMYQHGAGKGQWRWLLDCPAFKLYIGRGRLNSIVAQVRFPALALWSCEDPLTHEQDIWPWSSNWGVSIRPVHWWRGMDDAASL
jgi:hypothetical protein